MYEENYADDLKVVEFASGLRPFYTLQPLHGADIGIAGAENQTDLILPDFHLSFDKMHEHLNGGCP